MRGILYNSLIQNKQKYLASAIITAAFGIFGGILLSKIRTVELAAIIMPIILILAILFIPVICMDGIPKKTEKMIACGFTKYILTSGVSKLKYTLSNIVENIATTAYCYGLCAAFFGILKSVETDFVPVSFFKSLLLLMLFLGSVTELMNTATFFTKSAEKAEISVAALLALGIGIAITHVILRNEDVNIEITDERYIILAAVFVLFYILSGVITFLRLKHNST